MNDNEELNNVNHDVHPNTHADGLLGTMIFMIIAVATMITIRYFLNY